MKRKLNAGHLDRRIRLEQESDIKNAFNERTHDWQTVKECWAAKRDIEVKRDNEDVNERTVQSRGQTEWTIRYDATLYPMTIKRVVELMTNEVYDIVEVQEDITLRRQWMKLKCVRIQER